MDSMTIKARVHGTAGLGYWDMVVVFLGQYRDIRLTGGLVPQQGNVEVCIDGSWSRVCSRDWHYRNSFVVCRQLGYPATKAGKHYTFYNLPHWQTIYN